MKRLSSMLARARRRLVDLRSAGPVAGLRRLVAPLGVLVALAVATMVVSGVSEPHTMVSATVVTEFARIHVVSPQDGAFRLAAASIDEQCVADVFVEPAAGTIVDLTRPGKDELVIDVVGRSAWHGKHHRDDARQTQPRHLKLVVGNGPDCPAGRSVRLPVKGLVTFGVDLQEVPEDFALPQLALLSGELAVYGRSIVDLNFGPFQARTLYLSQILPIPPGSRIAAARHKRPSASGADAAQHPDDGSTPWYGFADVHFWDDGPPGLAIEASTNARYVELYPPAPFRVEGEVRGDRPDVVALSLAARLTGDPNLLWLLGSLTVATGLFAWGWSLWKDTRTRTDDDV